LSDGSDFNNQNGGALGLAMVYEKSHQPDSAAKYYRYAYSMNDSIYARMATSEIEQMNAMYNYSRHQKIAQEESEKAKRATEQFKTIASMLLFVILIAYIVVAREKQKRRDAVRSYRESIAKIEQVQTELARLNTLTNSQEEVIQQQKGQIRRQDGMIAKLQDEIVSFQSKVKKTKENKRENSLKSTDEYKAFVQHAEKYTTPSNLEWTELRTKVFEYLPDFHQLLLSKRHELNISEYNVCILVRLQFKLSDIANLERLSLSYINKIRKNLLRKLFGMEDKAEVFDEMIKEIY
jgi:preprotein translocase subunit YajC